MHFELIRNIEKIEVIADGNIVKGDLGSRTATKLVREWIDLHVTELEEDWQLACKNQKLKKIEPLK